MLILAKTKIGCEFVYNPRTAHAVSKAKAKTIMETLNDRKYLLKDGEKWHIYDIGVYDTAYVYAETQKFKVRLDTITEYR